MTVSEISRHEFAEELSVYSYRRSRDGAEKQDARDPARHIDDGFFVEVDGAAFEIKLENLGVPGLDELTDGCYELGRG